MQIKNRNLFFRYALPCADTLVKRGKITKSDLDEFLIRVSKNEDLPEGTEKVFTVAMVMCKLIAKKMKKKEIDDDVIRQYFLIDHDKIVRERYNLMKDFDPIACKTKIGTVVKIDGDKILVKTDFGENFYKSFIKNLKEGDEVVVHHNFIVDKLSANAKKNIFNRKPIL